MTIFRIRKPTRPLHVESLETRALLAAGFNVALYEFTTHDPGNGVEHLFSSDTDPLSTASDIGSALRLDGTGNGSPPRGLALGGAFNESVEPTPSGGQNDYFEFTVTPNEGTELSLARFSMQVRKNDPNSKDSYSVYFDNDPGPGGNNYSTRLLRQTITSEDVFETLQINLEPIAELTNQSTAITFRIYSWGTVGTGTARIDNVRLQAVAPTSEGSVYAYYGESGRLIHPLDAQGNRLADFSAAGYKNSNEPLPDVEQSIDASRFVQVAPIAGDNTLHLQNAIDQVGALAPDANGFRGVVQLTAGEFPIADQVRILQSGVILRGVGDGDDPLQNTVLRATGTTQRSLVVVGQDAGFASGTGGTSNITDKFVPNGATSFTVDSTRDWVVGDAIIVRRPSTQEWIEALGTDQIPPSSDGSTVTQWEAGQYDQLYEREITRIENNRVFINAPLMHSFDQQYGGGTVFRYTFPRIHQVGIENIRGVSDFNGPTDEEHATTFIELQAVEDAWVRGVTGKHFIFSTVHATSRSLRVTVEDAESLDPISIVTGGRRYPFLIDGQFVLMRDLYSEFGRHDFVNNARQRNRGPNVFLDGIAVNSTSATGPHQRYSTGTLYDTIVTDSRIEGRNSSNTGSGHGWTGANMVFWNTQASLNVVQNPPTAQNWLIGATGQVIEQTQFGPQPSGTYDSLGSPIDFGDPNNPTSSLFIAQHNQRLATYSDEPVLQRREYLLGDFDLIEYDGAGSADEAYADANWLSDLEGQSLASTRAATDIEAADQYVPMSFRYELAANESVYAAVLTLGLRGVGAGTSDDVVLLDSVSDSRTIESLAGTVISQTETTPVTIELFGDDLLKLQDGLLNLSVSNDTVVDWASLEIQVADNLAPTVVANSASVSGRVLETLQNSGTWGDPESQPVTLSASIGTITQEVGGTWAWSLDTSQRYDAEVVTITATDQLGRTSQTTFQITATTHLVRRGISYGNSAAFTEDDSPTGIVPLLPGETATDSNYSNYTKGLNRVVVEVAGLASETLSVNDDFAFRIGNVDDVTEWTLLSGSSSVPLPTVDVRPDPTNRTSVIVLSWPDQAIRDSWLQVTVKATPNTGLSTADVFYFGHQTGDVYGMADVNRDGQVRVNATDALYVRLNQSGGNPVSIENRYDVNRDGQVDNVDTVAVRASRSSGGLLVLTTAVEVVEPEIPAPSVANAGLHFLTFESTDRLQNRQLQYLNRLHARWQQSLQSPTTAARFEEIMFDRLQRRVERWEASAERLRDRGRVELAEERFQMAMAVRSLLYLMQSE